MSNQAAILNDLNRKLLCKAISTIFKPFPCQNPKSFSKFAKIFHMNVRSFCKHHDELEALVKSLESPPDIICLSETWFFECDDKYSYKLKG